MNRQQSRDYYRELVKNLTTLKQRRDLNIKLTGSAAYLENVYNSIQNRQIIIPERISGIRQYNQLRRRAVELGVYDNRYRKKEDIIQAIELAENPFARFDVILQSQPNRREIVFPLTELQNRLSSAKIYQQNKPFTLKLISSVNDDIFLEKNFKSQQHFINWFNIVNSERTNYNLPDILRDENVFSMVKYAIHPIKGGCTQTTDKIKRIENRLYRYHCKNLTSQRNDCGLECIKYLLDLNVSNHKLRKRFGLKLGEKICASTIIKIYNELAIEKKNYSTLCIIDKHNTSKIIKRNKDLSDHTEILSSNHYLMFDNQHYYVIMHIEDVKHRAMRGELFWDIETRKTNTKYAVTTVDENGVKSTKYCYQIRDVITCVYYRRAMSKTFASLTFTTTKEDGTYNYSVRQFIDWLKSESELGYFYTCVAHNGSRFDCYFLQSLLTQTELLTSKITLRGESIIGLEIFNHKFIDSYCFLTFSLDSLSKSFNVVNKKQKSFILNGIEISNEQLCFYRSELSFDDFLQLENIDKSFWDLYISYCLYDCISLSEVWTKFTKEANDLIGKISLKLLRSCRVNSALTIGSLALKIINGLNNDIDHTKLPKKIYRLYLEFLKDDGGLINREKYNFISLFKRGGISHCNKPGLHTEGVVSYDICSQYPASMMSMLIPAGKSVWVTSYDENKHGFYEVKDLIFSSNSKNFKPVSTVLDTKVLEWNTSNRIPLAYLDSEMIKYLKLHYGLMSFTVVKGLVSNLQIKGSQLFGRYVDVLFQEKAKQDALKKENKHNPALRETIKLFLNSATGKLVEATERYNSAQFQLRSDSCNSKKILQGYEHKNVESDSVRLNPFVVCGVMIYSYSKRLLFEYIRQLPQNSDDVIHVETDSIYFPKEYEDTFLNNISCYTGDYPCNIGDKLGFVKQEKDESGDCYFLGKKFYKIGACLKIKGIPLSTIDDYGKRINIVDESLYTRVYNGESVKVFYKSLVKSLYGETRICEVLNHRTVKPQMSYFKY